MFIAYAFYRRVGLNEFNYVAPEVSQSPLPSSHLTATPISSARPIVHTPTPTPTPTKNLGQYKDGQYTGVVADAYYGNVQVRATIQSGRITAVDFLDYPQDRRTSIEINNYAMPYLQQEAIQAQSAQVDIVSGATATSEAFKVSLASALSQAK